MIQITPCGVLLHLVMFGLAGQEETPAACLKHIEDRILKAKTLSVKVKIVSEVPIGGRKEKPGEASAVLLMKAGEKFHFSTTEVSREGRESKVIVVSDGTKLGAKMELSELGVRNRLSPAQNIPRNLNTGLGIRFARGGITFVVESRGTKVEDAEAEAKRMCPVANLKAGDGGKGARTLSYTVQPPNSPRSSEVTLWYDPDSHAVTKRVINVKIGLLQTTYTETYSEWTIDADIPDEKFRLPGP